MPDTYMTGRSYICPRCHAVHDEECFRVSPRPGEAAWACSDECAELIGWFRLPGCGSLAELREAHFA